MKKLQYHGIDKNKNEELISLLALGTITALQNDLISYEEAWNTVFNIRVLDFLKSEKSSTVLIKAIHLGTELGDVKRIVPNSYTHSCNEIEQLLKSFIKDNSINANKIEYLFDFQ